MATILMKDLGEKKKNKLETSVHNLPANAKIRISKRCMKFNNCRTQHSVMNLTLAEHGMAQGVRL